ncbi:MAG: DUF5104 domain-containing protein [Oscillospiraceae bacterium]|nr:DUF5104 domain-containing protein [Oscillospiraceae bacterium]
MLKKLFCVIICAAMLCGITGCGVIKINYDSTSSTDDVRYFPSRASREMFYSIQRYLKKGNAEALSELFAEDYSTSIDEVQDALNFIDGKILSFDKERLHTDGGKKREGKYTYYSYGGSFYAITDNGKRYLIDFAGCVVDDETPGNVGLEHIRIWDDPNENPKIILGF